MSTNVSQRILWIDLGKCLAIIGVLINHTFGDVFTYMSFYSVGLFILLSGYSEYLSYQKHPVFSFRFYCKRILFMLFQYSIAIGITMALHAEISLQKFVLNLTSFNAQYYYFAFYFQLMLIAPILERLCDKIRGKLCQTILSFGVLLLAVYFTQNKVFDIYGGGACILGGSYLFLYYLGMLAAKVNLPEKLKKYGTISRLILLFITIGWGYAFATYALPFDSWVENRLGVGINPPSINLCVYACLVFVTVISFGQKQNAQFLSKKAISFFVWIGQNTLPIFLYHVLLISDIGKFLHNNLSNQFFIFIVIFIIALILPALCNTVFRKACTLLKQKVWKGTIQSSKHS